MFLSGIILGMGAVSEKRRYIVIYTKAGRIAIKMELIYGDIIVQSIYIYDIYI